MGGGRDVKLISLKEYSFPHHRKYNSWWDPQFLNLFKGYIFDWVFWCLFLWWVFFLIVKMVTFFFTAVMRQRYLWVFPVCYQLLARISDKLFKETFKGQCYKTTTLCQSLCSSKAGPVSFCIQIEPQRKIITGFPQLKFFLWLSVPFHYRLCYMHSNGFLLLI